VQETRAVEAKGSNTGCKKEAPVEDEELVVVFTRENRGGDPLNTQHSQHRPVQATDR